MKLLDFLVGICVNALMSVFAGCALGGAVFWLSLRFVDRSGIAASIWGSLAGFGTAGLLFLVLLVLSIAKLVSNKGQEATAGNG